MSNTYFKFKQFTIHHERCAMKVGTDGVLLGALAAGGPRILDIGTGSGLVALMMAQRFTDSQVTAIDIDKDAVEQAQYNALASPFGGRVNIMQCDFTLYNDKELFDSIVCNPPFFENSQHCPDEQRSAARHASSLPFASLMSKSAELLSPQGTLTLIIPTDALGRIEEEASYAGLFICRKIYIKTVERKAPKRVLVFLTKHAPSSPQTETQCLMEDGQRSKWYTATCEDFYL